MKRLLALLFVAGLLLAACGGEESAIPSDAVTIVASSDIGLGQERLLVGLSDDLNNRLGSPDDEVTISVAPEADRDARQEATGEWTWIVPDGIGLYRASFDFDTVGLWEVTVTPKGGDPLETVPFEVREDTAAPALGEDALAAPTPTLDDYPLDELTTDPDPNPAFYEMTIEEALASGRQTVLVFSTPAYCQTASCGPLLDHVKEVAPNHPDANFIHIEVYTDLKNPEFQPSAAFLAPAATGDWYALPSEPWVFLIDEDGKIAGRFEGVMDPSEIDAALG